MKAITGHFKLNVIDKDGNIIDTVEDSNMIMNPASIGMAGIFSGERSGLTRFSLGTMGNHISSILVPKTSANGFVKTRDRMFSETKSYGTGAVINANMGDVIHYTVDGNYYEYVGAVTIPPLAIPSTTVNATNLANAALWKNLGTVMPYTYDINFVVSGTTVAAPGSLANSIVETNTGVGSTVHVLTTNNSVIFTIDVVTAAANSQSANMSIFTEASLYSGAEIFSLKTFPAKIKDNTVALQIVWTISF